MKIRTKIIIAFFVVIIPFTIGGLIISLLNMQAIQRSLKELSVVENEIHITHNLQLTMHMGLMTVNDYIITGDRKYINGFKNVSTDMDNLLRNVENKLNHKEKIEIIKDIRIAWQNIKEISYRIFKIPNPVGNKNASNLIREIYYKSAYPAIKRFERWKEIGEGEHSKSTENIGLILKRTWYIFLTGIAIFIVFGVYFALFFSRYLSTKLETIKDRTDIISKGNFKVRLDIKSGDEFEELGNAINDMSTQLDSLYSNLEDKVEERTRDLQFERDKAKMYLDIAGVMFVVIDTDEKVSLINRKGCEILNCRVDEVIGRNWFDMFIPERIRSDVRGTFRRIIRGEGVADEYFENPILRRDGEERIISWHNTVIRNEAGEIVATLSSGEDITEKKKIEEDIRQKIEELERFRKATVQREFRMKELIDENERLKKKFEDFQK